MATNPSVESGVGPLLRTWRQRRHLSQLDLASAAGVSSRHLSFVETGRSRPSREMVLHLAEHLDIPLRARNNLLLAGGYAPTYRETDLDAPPFQPVRHALDAVLAGHEPYPAIIVDRHWNLVSANTAALLLVEGVAPHLLEPPTNALRMSLHPDGLAPRIINFAEWTDHVLGALRRNALISGDEELLALEQELRGYGEDQGLDPAWRSGEGPGELAIPLRLRSGDGELALITTLATFGTAVDVTLAELTLEAFLPADAETAAALHARAASAAAQT
jgi:transcriptional regulator with XRE-family HTH domain